MPNDPYAPCPCGSGKKLKWCCAKIDAEMQGVERLMEKEQYAAALRAAEKLAGKWPDNPWVLSTLADLQSRNGQVETFEATIDRLLRIDPHHPVGLASRAITALHREPLPAALTAVQEAIVHGSEKRPALVGNLALGAALLAASKGNILAAREHLFLADELNSESEAGEILESLDGSLAILPLWKEDHVLKQPEDVAEKPNERVEESLDLADTGAWAEAARRFEALTAEVPGCKEFWYDLGLCRAWMTENAGAAEALHRYAALESEFDDAVEAEALALLLDRAPWNSAAEAVRVDYAVCNLAQLREALEADDRCRPLEMPDSEAEDSPATVIAAYHLLDRPGGQWKEGLKASDLPWVLAEVRVYKADGPAGQPRLELSLPRDQRYEEARGLLARIAGDALGDPADPVTLPLPLEEPHPVRLRWQWPDRTPVEEMRRLRDEERTRFLEEVWTVRPLAQLGGLSPLEASRDGQHRVALAAMLLIFEERFLWEPTAPPLVSLRARLGLPPCEPVDADGVSLHTLPLARFGRLQPSRLGDEALLEAFERAKHARVVWAELRLGEEILRRPALKDQEDFGLVCLQLMRATFALDDCQRALKWIAEARGYDQDAERDLCGSWDINELIVRLSIPGSEPEVERLLRHISTDHADDENVQRSLAELLHRMGLLPAEGQPETGAEPEEPAILVPGGTRAGQIWTPEQEQAAAPRPKLWVPGQP